MCACDTAGDWHPDCPEHGMDVRQRREDREAKEEEYENRISRLEANMQLLIQEIASMNSRMSNYSNH